MATEITEVELLEALRDALEQGDGERAPGLTTEEIGAAMNCNLRVVRALLKPLVRSGGIVSVRGRRPGIDGVMRPVPIYRVVQEEAGDEDS